MALNKSSKIWIITLSIPVVLVVVAIIGAKIYFTSDRLKGLIIPRLEEVSHRTVAVDDISISVFPSLAVSIDGLRISNPTGAAFDRDQFLSLDNLKLHVKILPLLRSRLEITHVSLNHPIIYLEVTKDGRSNYSNKKSGQEKAPESRSEQGNTGGLILSNAEISDGVIELVNRKFDSRIMIAGLHLSSRAETRSDEKSIRLDATSTIDTFSYGTLTSWYLTRQPLTVTARLAYHTDSDVLSFESVTGKLKDLPFSVTGSISKLMEDVNMMDLAINSPGAEMTQLLSLVPPEMLKKAEGLASSGDVKFALTIRGQSGETVNPGTKGTFTVTGGTIHYASLPKSITNINISGSFEKPEAPVDKKDIGSFALEKFTASLGASEFSGNLLMKNFADPTLSATFRGALNLSEVKDFYPLEKGSEFSGQTKANIALDGKAKSPQSIRASGTVEFSGVTIKTAGSTQPLNNLNGTISFNNQVVESKQLAMTVGESDLNLAFTLRNYLGLVMEDAAKSSGKPSATVTLSSKQLRTTDLTGDETAPEKKESGNRKGDQKKQGMLPGFDIDANIKIDKLITDKFTFTNARGLLAISNGIINLKNVSVNAFDGQIQTKGTLDLRDLARRPFDLDLNIDKVESNALLPNFTSFGKYLHGKFSMNTKLRGDLNDTLGLNPTSLAGNGDVNVLDGKLLGFPLTQKLSEFTNLAELREVNFKDWTNSFSISDGRLNIKDLKVNAGSTDFLVNGSQGLDGSLDYGMTVKLPGALTDRINLRGVGSELVQLLKDKEGRLNLNFQVTGDATNPVLRLDTQAQKDALRKSLEDKTRSKVEEGLKKLFKRP